MKNINKLIQFKSFISILVLMIFVSCTSLSPYKVPVLQGNIFEEEDIEKLSEGLTKDQVQFIFGTALVKDPFHPNRWDYYYSIKVGTELLSESKLSISFNDDQLVDSWIIEKVEDSN
tara:strand:- start:297 stop:647 length:351 start_codon:yes stop_codon:yes gene_type:complete